MNKLKLLLLGLLSLLLLLGCEQETVMHEYRDISSGYADKFNIDLSDRGRYSEDGDVRITEAGVYRIFGNAEQNGRILVDAHPRAEITLRLDGALLAADSGNALYIKSAGRVKLVLSEGTKTTLSSVGGSGAAVLRSDIPLSLEGDGTLLLASDSGEGMSVRGDLSLLGGTLDITSQELALRAEGALTLLGGTLNAASRSAGISADLLTLTEGRLDISAREAAFVSSSDILIEGGEALVCVHDPDGGCAIVTGGGVIRQTGGQFISLSEGHAVFSEDTEINRINITLSDEVSVDNVRITDIAGGGLLLSDSAHLPLQYLTFSSPELKEGEQYRVWAGDINTKLTQSGAVAEKTVSTQPAHMTELSYGGLDYLLYTPAYVSEKLPMLVFLHGSGEKGDDLSILTLAPSLPGFLADGTLAIDAYVIIPQCPATEKNWQSVTDKLEAVIEHSRNTLPIIRNKVALTGHSMGGNGVWVLAIRHPERYSKAAPLSGWVDMTEDNLKALSRIPIWDVVGELDTAVPPIESKPMTDALKAARADVRVTVFEGAKHNEVPTLAYLGDDVGLIEWLLG